MPAYVPLPGAFFERIVAESLKLPARLWRAVFDGILAYDDAAQIGQIKAPTLLLWGERDVLFPRAAVAAGRAPAGACWTLDSGETNVTRSGESAPRDQQPDVKETPTPLRQVADLQIREDQDNRRCCSG